MSVTIKLSNGTQETVEVPDLGITVAKFKEIAAAAIKIPADEQRVVLRGRVLKDNDVLSAMGMEHGQAVHIVRGQKSTAKPVATSTTTTTTTTGGTTRTSTDSQIETNARQSQTTANSQGGSENINPYMALAGNPPASSGSNSNNFQSPGAGLPMSPESMLQMMQNPMMSQLIQETMRNPQLMQQMMQMQSPDRSGVNDMVMQQLLSNPAFLQQTMQMMNNPAFLQQMMQSMGGASGAQNSPFFGQPNLPSINPIQGAGFSQPQGDPRVIYQTQLQQLREMGFPNEEANIAALQQAQGNLDFAIERLLNA